MPDPLYELNKQFNEREKKRDTCGMNDCYAPKVDELPTEGGVVIAVCAYHKVFLQGEKMREKLAQKWYDRSFEEIKEDWKEYNSKISGDAIDRRDKE